MASFMQIFAIIGFLALFIGIIYLIKAGMAAPASVQYSEAYPPNDYMLNIGTKCPDMWTNMGYNMRGSAQYVRCRNDYDVPTTSTSCYTDPNNKVKEFRNIMEWPMKPGTEQRTLRSRCQWIKQCGPIAGTRASWSGIVDKCV